MNIDKNETSKRLGCSQQE